MNEGLRKKTLNNLMYSFSAQIISVLLSTFMSLVVPKILGIKEYGYWQLFLFYINYVGFFHFGITDGMYLKNGGIEYEKIDKRNISSQFYTLLITQILILIIVSSLSITFITNSIRMMILICTGIYMIIANMNWFLGYVFQATNRVKLYSISVMIDKIIFLIFIILSFIFKFKNLYVYIPFFIFTTFCALLFSVYNSKEIVFTKPYPLKDSFKLSYQSAKVGINLTLASVSSMLILGVGRFLVDKVWGIESFGKFSFSLSLTNFFLLFIAQVSVVLFPTLRQVKPETAKKLFKTFNNMLNSYLPLIYVLYIPMKFILGLWLPQYKISLNYLAMLLPICIFDGKNQMINNTYFKVLREEKKMLKINIITLIISTILSFVSVYFFKNIYFVIITMLISVAFRSIYGELYLYKKMNVESNIKGTIYELIYSILFVTYNITMNNLYAFVSIIITFIIYIIITKSYKYYYETIESVNKRLIKRKKSV